MSKTTVHAEGRRNTTHTLDGIEIIAREDAFGVHPNPKVRAVINRLVKYSDITKLLLANGDERFECDFCGWTSPTADSLAGIKSISAHVNGVHRSPRRGRALYTVETIKHILREVEYQKRIDMQKATIAKRKPYSNSRICEIVADQLNAKNVKTVQGGKWTGHGVYSLFKTYTTRYRIVLTPTQLSRIKAIIAKPLPSTRLNRTAAEARISDMIDAETAEKLKHTADSKSTPKPNTIHISPKKTMTTFNAVDASAPVFDRLSRLRKILSDVVNGGIMNIQTNVLNANETLDSLTKELNTYVENTTAALASTPEAQPMDPEIVEKASRFDALKDLLGYKFDDAL